MSHWNVIVNGAVEKRLSKLPKKERDRISDAIDELGDDPLGIHLDVKQLQGRPERRLRVGQWRVLYRLERKIVTILVVGLDTRGDAYK